MGRIISSDGVGRRAIPVRGLSGDVEFDLAGEKYVLTVPPDVDVEYRPE